MLVAGAAGGCRDARLLPVVGDQAVAGVGQHRAGARIGRRIDRELDALGIIARARGHKGLAEEQPAAYKDVDQVVEIIHKAGISKKVARLRPVGVIKG